MFVAQQGNCVRGALRYLGAESSEMMKTTSHNSSRDRILTGLLGAPIAHSASPAMHERAAEALGLRCHYQLVEAAGPGREDVKPLHPSVRRPPFPPISLTLPHHHPPAHNLDALPP